MVSELNPCIGCLKYARGCSWSERLVPVKGWTAVPVYKHDQFYTWKIIECPEFVKEPEKPKEEKPKRNRYGELISEVMTQNETIINYMKANPNAGITSLEAIEKFKILRLASRINDLKKAGYNIVSTTQYKYDDDGKKKQWVRYFLIG